MADKRTMITKSAIKDGLLELLETTSFNDISISQLCRAAGVGRATFYTHYKGITDVLDDLAEDAIKATSRKTTTDLSSIFILAEKMRKNTSVEELDSYMDLLPVCQRVSDNPKYHILFNDPFISEYLLLHIYHSERAHFIPFMTSNYHITSDQADSLFLFMITGAFAINRSKGWKKDQSWFEAQRVLMTFLEGGFDFLSKL